MNTKIIAVSAAAVILLTACHPGATTDKSAPDEKNETKTQIVKEVRLVAPVHRKASVTLRESVTLDPEERGAISAKVGATILKILVEENQRVNKDQIIATLDSSDYVLGLEQARAGLAGLEAQHNGLKNDLQRVQSLRDKDMASQQQLDNLQTQVTALESQMEANRKTIDMMSRNVKDTKVRAPFSGVITSKKMTVGSRTVTAMPDGADIAFIQKIDRLKVNIQVSEIYFSELQTGDPVSFFVPALNRTVEAAIHSKGSTLSDMKKFSILVYIDNKDMLIPAGISAIATMKTREQDRILVPPTAVKVTGDRTAELFAVVNGVVASVPVITGFPFEEGLEVNGNVPELIVNDASLVRSGEPVSAQK